MHCPNCSNEVPDDKRFCGHCGHKFAAAPPTDPARPAAVDHEAPTRMAPQPMGSKEAEPEPPQSPSAAPPPPADAPTAEVGAEATPPEIKIEAQVAEAAEAAPAEALVTARSGESGLEPDLVPKPSTWPLLKPKALWIGLLGMALGRLVGIILASDHNPDGTFETALTIFLGLRGLAEGFGLGLILRNLVPGYSWKKVAALSAAWSLPQALWPHLGTALGLTISWDPGYIAYETVFLALTAWLTAFIIFRENLPAQRERIIKLTVGLTFLQLSSLFWASSMATNGWFGDINILGRGVWGGEILLAIIFGGLYGLFVVTSLRQSTIGEVAGPPRTYPALSRSLLLPAIYIGLGWGLANIPAAFVYSSFPNGSTLVYALDGLLKGAVLGIILMTATKKLRWEDVFLLSAGWAASWSLRPVVGDAMGIYIGGSFGWVALRLGAVIIFGMVTAWVLQRRGLIHGLKTQVLIVAGLWVAWLLGTSVGSYAFAVDALYFIEIGDVSIASIWYLGEALAGFIAGAQILALLQPPLGE